MKACFSTTATREVERRILDTGVDLMTVAGQEIACAIRTGAGITNYNALSFLVGPGNNGGDALIAARELAADGYRVGVFYCTPKHHDLLPPCSGVYEWDISSGIISDAAAHFLADSSLWVDGILGIGATGPMREPLVAVMEALCDLQCHIRTHTREPYRCIAIDVPTGICPATGHRTGPTLATDLVLEMGLPLDVLHLPPARSAYGSSLLIPLGMDDGALAAPTAIDLSHVSLKDFLTTPGPSDHKYSRGIVALDTGSLRYPGAARLSVGGAFGGGPGMVCYTGACYSYVLDAYPEAVIESRLLAQAGAFVIGSGWSPTEISAHMGVMEKRPSCAFTLVVDATAIPAVLQDPEFYRCVVNRDPASTEAPVDVIFTPHAGELAHALEVLGIDMPDAPDEASRIVAAGQLLADAVKSSVLVKGFIDVVCVPGKAPLIGCRSTGWRATAGAGDILAGLIGSFAARMHATAAANGGVMTITDPESAALLEGYPIGAVAGVLAANVHATAARIASQRCMSMPDLHAFGAEEYEPTEWPAESTIFSSPADFFCVEEAPIRASEIIDALPKAYVALATAAAQQG